MSRRRNGRAWGYGDMTGTSFSNKIKLNSRTLDGTIFLFVKPPKESERLTEFINFFTGFRQTDVMIQGYDR